MILNLKILNRFVKVKNFKMASLRLIMHALDGGLWACMIDLQDAYFNIAIRESHGVSFRSGVGHDHRRSLDKIQEHVIVVLLGIMASRVDLALRARLHKRPISLYLLSKWRPRSYNLEKLIQVEKSVKDHLLWWTKRRNLFRG